MPGSSAIFGLIPCTNCHYIYNDKPWTVTIDCEIVLGVDENSEVNTTTALLQHFNPLGSSPPINSALYFVFGKIAPLESIANGEGFSPEEYDFVVDANMVHALHACSIGDNANSVQAASYA
jgi:hypothetical protein